MINQQIDPFLQRETGSHYPAKSVDAILGLLERAEHGDIIAQADLFADMQERDVHISSEMYKRKMAVAQLDWGLKPPSDAGEKEKATIATLESLIMDTMDIEALVMAMCDAIGHGYQGTQLEWSRDNVMGWWIPAETHPKPARYMTVDQETRSQLRLRDSSSISGVEFMDHGWIIHQHKSKIGTPATQGLFRSLALPYLFKNFATKNWLRFCENYGVPVRVLFHNEKDTARKNKLIASLKAMGASGVALIEGGISDDLKTMDVTSGEGQGFKALIDWCEESESKAILGGTLTSSTGKNGNYATASVHDDVRLQIRNHDAGQIKNTLTRQLLKSIVALNGLQIRPRWWFDTQEPEDLALYADALPKLVTIGAKIPTKWAHEKLKIPLAEDGEDVLQTTQQPVIANPQAIPPKGKGPDPLGALSSLSAVSLAHKPKFTPEQQAVESLADALLSNLQAPIDPESIAAAIRGARNPEDLESRLAAVLDGASLEQFSTILERALFAADVMGYVHA